MYFDSYDIKQKYYVDQINLISNQLNDLQERMLDITDHVKQYQQEFQILLEQYEEKLQQKINLVNKSKE